MNSRELMDASLPVSVNSVPQPDKGLPDSVYQARKSLIVFGFCLTLAASNLLE